MEKLRIATVEPYIDTAYEYLSTKLFVKTQFPTALLEQTSVLQSRMSQFYPSPDFKILLSSTFKKLNYNLFLV